MIISPDPLGEVRPGEIVVAPGTSSSWAVAFSIIKGLVSDGGGALSHPVIMAREFGIPCVSGCVEGTKKIKTGQRIRVDGNQGVVCILDKMSWRHLPFDSSRIILSLVYHFYLPNLAVFEFDRTLFSYDLIRRSLLQCFCPLVENTH